MLFFGSDSYIGTHSDALTETRHAKKCLHKLLGDTSSLHLPEELQVLKASPSFSVSIIKETSAFMAGTL